LPLIATQAAAPQTGFELMTRYFADAVYALNFAAFGFSFQAAARRPRLPPYMLAPRAMLPSLLMIGRLLARCRLIRCFVVNRHFMPHYRHRLADADSSLHAFDSFAPDIS